MKSILAHTKKKGQLSALPQSIIALVVAIIILVIGVVIIQEMRDSRLTNALGCNATDTHACADWTTANESLVAMGDFSDFIPIIVIAMAASIVIGLILIGFAFRGRER